MSSVRVHCPECESVRVEEVCVPPRIGQAIYKRDLGWSFG